MVNETTKRGKNGLPNIFRREAIDALNTLPIETFELKNTSPAAWGWVVASMLILCSVILWGALYKLSFTIESPGIVLSLQQINETEKAINKTIQDKNEHSMELADLYNKKSELYNRHYLTRVDLLHAKQEYIAANQDLIESKQNLLIPIFQTKTSSKTVAIVFVDYLHGKDIQPGMRGYVAPTLAKQKRTQGHVVGASQYPTTKQLANYYLKNIGLVDAYFNRGIPFLVKFAIESNNISPGTPIIVNINYRSCTPLQLILKSSACE